MIAMKKINNKKYAAITIIAMCMLLFNSCGAEKEEVKLNGPYSCLIPEAAIALEDESLTVDASVFDRIIYDDVEVSKLKVGDTISVDKPSDSGHYRQNIEIEDIRLWDSSDGIKHLYTINDNGISFEQLGHSEYDRLLKTDEGWIFNRHYSNSAVLPYWRYIDDVKITLDSKTVIFTTYAAEDPMAQSQIKYKDIGDIEGSLFGMAHITDNYVDYIVLILDWQHFY